MRIDDIIIENQNLEEGPVWDKTRQVGATIGKGIGGVGQAVGAVAGVPAGFVRAIGKGYNRAADTIAGGPDENPQQGGAQAPQQGQAQSAGSSFAQGLQGGSSGGSGGGAVAGKLRQQAKQLMAMADELEKDGAAGGGGAQKAEPQGQQSAPPAQAKQEPPQASSAQSQSTTQAPAADQSQDWPKIPGGGEATINPDTGEKFASPADAHAYLDARAKETPALAAPAQQQAPADNVSTPSSTGGQTNQTDQGLKHKANPDNPNFKQAGAQDVTDVEPKQVAGQQPQLKMIPGGKGTAADPNVQSKVKANIAASRAARQGSKFDPTQKYAAEGIQYYSRFLRGMI